MLKIKDIFKSKATKYKELIINSLKSKKDIEIDLFADYKAIAFKRIFEKFQDNGRINKMLSEISTIENDFDRECETFEAKLLYYRLKPIMEINDDSRVKDRYLTLEFSKLNKKDYDYLVEKIEE